jgi:hypothetical protein
MVYAPEYHKNARRNLTSKLDRERRTAEMVLQAWDWVRYFLRAEGAREPQDTTMRETARQAVLEAGAQTTGKDAVPLNMMWLVEYKEESTGSITFNSARTGRKLTLQTV